MTNHDLKISTCRSLQEFPKFTSAKVWLAILSIVLFCFLSDSAKAENNLPFTDAADAPITSKVMSLKINGAIWPCFPNHFFLKETSLSDKFALTDSVNVEVTDHAELLSGRDWSHTCKEIYDLASPPTGRELLKIGKVYEFEPAVSQVELEDFFSLLASIEIWQLIAKELVASQRFEEAFVVTSKFVIFTYKHMALCSLNIELRERFPILCNYRLLKEMMTSSWTTYNLFIEEYELELSPSGMRSSVHGSTSLAFKQSNLILNWE